MESSRVDLTSDGLGKFISLCINIEQNMQHFWLTQSLKFEEEKTSNPSRLKVVSILLLLAYNASKSMLKQTRQK